MIDTTEADIQLFASWIKRKIRHHLSEDYTRIYFYEREIWWTALGKNIGFEIDGKYDTFERPVLVFKKYSRHMALVLPLTTKVREHFPYHAPFTFQEKYMAAVLSQVRVISSKRLLRKAGKIDPNIFEEIRNAFLQHI